MFSLGAEGTYGKEWRHLCSVVNWCEGSIGSKKVRVILEI